MKMSSNFLLALTLLAVPSLLLAETMKQAPITIGVVQSLTGVAAQDGNTVVRSLRIAADDLSKRGTEVSLVVEDDAFDPKTSISAFRKLQMEHVDAIIGATWSATTNPLAPLAASAKLVLLNVSTLPEGLDYQSGNGFLFSNALALDPETAPFRDYLRWRKIKSAILIQNGSPWGDVQAKRYIAFLEEAKIPSSSLKGNKSDGNSWDELLPLIKASSPDLIIILSGKLDTENILRRGHDLAIRALFFSSKNTMDAWHLAPNKEIFTDSLCFTYPLAQLRGAREFYAEYKKRYGEEPTIYADNAYDSLFILNDALRQARATGMDLASVMRQYSFSGIAGGYTYSEKSSLGGGKSSLLCFQDGKPEVVK